MLGFRGGVLQAVAVVVGVAVGGVLQAASPQVAAVDALQRDASRLRRTVESSGAGAIVGEVCRLQDSVGALREKLLAQACAAEIRVVVIECIRAYNCLATSIERDPYVSRNLAVAEAMRCTAGQLERVVQELARYQGPAAHAPRHGTVPHIPEPEWARPEFPPSAWPGDGQRRYRPSYPNHFPSSPWQSHPGEFSLPRGEFETPNLPIEIGGAQRAPQPEVGRVILERILTEMLR